MTQCIEALERGAFSDANLAATEAILTAAPACAYVVQRGSEEDDAVKQRRSELRTCVAYELATRVLVRIGLDANGPPMSEADRVPTVRATRARFLADIPLRIAHRAACARAALKCSADAQNWGVAADLIRMLLPLDPPDKAKLQEQLSYCEEKGLTNANFRAYKLMCFKTLQPIDGNPRRCALCQALFAPTTVDHSAKCPLCKEGEVK